MKKTDETLSDLNEWVSVIDFFHTAKQLFDRIEMELTGVFFLTEGWRSVEKIV